MTPVGKPGKQGALMPVEVALARLLELAEAAPIREVERLPLAATEGRVLAEDLISSLDLPPWPNSAMDGYALRLADWQGEPLPVSQRIFAGQSPEPLLPGTCARIFTGAPVPAGADCVEMQENAEVLDDQRVHFSQPLTLQQNIRPQGQETTVGERVLPAGTRLGPIEQGLAASLGCAELAVIRRRSSILSTGGVSVGEADFLGVALREEGELDLWKLAIKPGKPLTFGHFRGVPVIGLPGNPASTLVTFALLARPYLLRRQGVQEVAPLRFQVPAGFVWAKPGNRREYLRARLENGRAILYRNQSSGVLRSAAWAEGLVEVLEGTTLAEGDWLNFIPLSEVLG